MPHPNTDKQKEKNNKEKACVTNPSNPELHGSGTRGTHRNLENVYVDFGGANNYGSY